MRTPENIYCTTFSDIWHIQYASKKYIDGYPFGFNTQEKVNEINGIGNHNTALFWEYDTRLGRRWNRDPVIHPWESSYAVMGGNPIARKDVKGDDWYKDKKSGITKFDASVHGQKDLKKGQKYIGETFEGKDKKGHTVLGDKDGNAETILSEVTIKGSLPQSVKDQRARDNALAKEVYPWKRMHELGYGPYRATPPDAIGISVSGSFIFGGGASHSFSIGWMRGVGPFATSTTGGGLGADVSVGISGFAAYYKQSGTPDFSTFEGLSGQAGAGISILAGSISQDLSKNRMGQFENGNNWTTYSGGLSLGADDLSTQVSGSTQITTTTGVTLQDLRNWVNGK